MHFDTLSLVQLRFYYCRQSAQSVVWKSERSNFLYQKYRFDHIQMMKRLGAICLRISNNLSIQDMGFHP